MHEPVQDGSERDVVAALLQRLGDAEGVVPAGLSALEARRERVVRLLALVEELRSQPVPRIAGQRRPPDEAWTPST